MQRTMFVNIHKQDMTLEVAEPALILGPVRSTWPIEVVFIASSCHLTLAFEVLAQRCAGLSLRDAEPNKKGLD